MDDLKETRVADVDTDSGGSTAPADAAPDTTDAPAPIAVNFTNIPDIIKQSCQFCTWKREKGKDGRLTKVPYTPGTGYRASTDKASTFRDFVTTAGAYAVGGYNGIGIRVAPVDGKPSIGAIDIDHCFREDGTLNDVASGIVALFHTAYFEKSPSGTGLRGFFKVEPDYIYDKTKYYINNRKLGLEIYIPGATNRFVTVTGNVYRAGEGDAVPLDMEALTKLLDTYMKRKTQVTNTKFEACSYLSDEAVIEHASHSTSGDRFMDYYNGRWQDYFDNQSDADMGFVSMLCFWCGCDEEQIDRIFRSSGMYRPKWDEKRGGRTYGELTIQNAVASCSTIYLPVDPNSIDPNTEFNAVLDEGSGPGDDDSSTADNGAGDNDSTSAGTDRQRVDNHGRDLPLGEDYVPDYSRVTANLNTMKPQSNPRYGRDEIGLGNIFADYFKPIARYNSDRGVWYVFDGHIWRPDLEGLKVAEMAKRLADLLYTYALNIRDEAVRTRYINRVQKLQKRKNRDTMIKDARSVHPIPMDAFDHDTHLFNCKNGTLDLRTMKFRDHDPHDFLTMMSGVTYDPEATCPRWYSFINEVMCGDEALADYLQRALGYALTGDTSLECMFILYGATSRNGKGTTMETFLKIMGDYGKTSNPEMLGAKFGNANSGGPSEEVARLAGIRFVNISEPEKKVSFNAALVKRMTGNDTLNARFLHENSFDFRPVFKIFINTNYLPNVSDMTLFESGRLKIIPFKRHFEESEQDKGLKGKFAEDHNLSAIFNWCIEGYKKFTKDKLESPEAVKAATAEYEEDSDRIGQFINSWLENDERYEVRTMAVYRLYNTFCEDYGYKPENYKNFRAALSKTYKIGLKRPADASNGTDKVSLVFGCRLRSEELGKEEGEGEVLESTPATYHADEEFSTIPGSDAQSTTPAEASATSK